MKRKGILTTLFILIIITITTLISNIMYNGDLEKDNYIASNLYAYNIYDIDIDTYNVENYVIDDNIIYILYKNSNNYIVKQIDILTNKEQTYTYNTTDSCTLQNNSNTSYISCKSTNSITLYNIDFTKILQTNNITLYDYALNINDEFKVYKNNNTDYPEVLSSICISDTCLMLRYNNLTEVTSIYKNTTIIEEYITNYGQYQYGFYTLNDNIINIYNITDTYTSYITENLDNKIITVSKNNYLYVVDEDIIKVLNLQDNSNITNINISNIYDEIESIRVMDNYLYIYTNNYLYVYNIDTIEDTNTVAYNNSVDELINYYKDAYNVTISIDSILLSSDYDITNLTDYDDIYSTLVAMEDYLSFFGSDFFSKFYDNNMNGINISIVSKIDVLKDGYETTEVVGLYYKSNNKYNIVVEANNMYTTLCHETMHVIDDYLENGFPKWSSLNPSDFTYSHVYYVNKVFSDTIGNYYNNVYFIDNYARSSELEDRARIMEYICTGEDLSMYPNLQKKVDYLLETLYIYFPEIYSSLNR